MNFVLMKPRLSWYGQVLDSRSLVSPMQYIVVCILCTFSSSFRLDDGLLIFWGCPGCRWSADMDFFRDVQFEVIFLMSSFGWCSRGGVSVAVSRGTERQRNGSVFIFSPVTDPRNVMASTTKAATSSEFATGRSVQTLQIPQYNSEQEWEPASFCTVLPCARMFRPREPNFATI